MLVRFGPRGRAVDTEILSLRLEAGSGRDDFMG